MQTATRVSILTVILPSLPAVHVCVHACVQCLCAVLVCSACVHACVQCLCAVHVCSACVQCMCVQCLCAVCGVCGQCTLQSEVHWIMITNVQC